MAAGFRGLLEALFYWMGSSPAPAACTTVRVYAGTAMVLRVAEASSPVTRVSPATLMALRVECES